MLRSITTLPRKRCGTHSHDTDLHPGGLYRDRPKRQSSFCEIFYENNAGEQLIWEQMLISANNALTLVLDNEYDTEEEHVIGGHIATVYTYVDGYAMAYYEADNYVYVITADHMTAEEMFQLIASMDI